MRLWAGLALLCLMVAGCQHLPDGVIVDVENRTVSVGPCRCTLPAPAPAPIPAANGQAPSAEVPAGGQAPDDLR
jgi:hypothetical protein